VNISHEEYLKQILKSKKIEVENLNINNMIAIAEYNARKEMIIQQMNSIERQLDNSNSQNNEPNKPNLTL
jgi:hypothetical protein